MKQVTRLFCQLFILLFLVGISLESKAVQVTFPKSKGDAPAMAEPRYGLGMVQPSDHDARLSCVGSTSLFARLVYDTLTIGFYEVARASFSMTDAQDPNGQTTCQNVDPVISYKVLHYQFPFSWDWDTYSEYAGDSNWFLLPPLVMKVATQSDQLCVQLWMPLLGYQNIGCKYQADPSKTTVNFPCFVADSCLGNTHNNQNLFRITSNVIECLNDTIASIFFSPAGCSDASGANDLNTFQSFRDNMRSIVRMMLTLYIIFFGMKVALSGDMPPAPEVITFVLKMVLVIYFSVGLPYPGAPGGYQDGVSFVYTFFTSASSDLSDLMYTAGGVQGLCYYPQHLYGNNAYLALWDSIDCRIAYYLGLNFLNSGITQAVWQVIMGAVLSFQVIFAIVLVIFLVFFISIIVHFTHVFALSLIAIALLVYMAPLFVPFALFNQTKGFFDSWLKQLISYSLQPMILAAFIALLLTVFDSQVFGSCSFTSQQLPSYSWLSVFAGDGVTLSDYWGFTVANPDDADCNKTFGYTLTFASTKLLNPKDLFFFTIDEISPHAVDAMLMNLLTLVLFSFLFHGLANQVGLIAADITGGAPLSKMAVGATAVFDKAAHLAKAYIKSKMGDKKGSKEELEKAAGDDAKVARKGSGGGGGGEGVVGKAQKASEKGGNNAVKGNSDEPGNAGKKAQENTQKGNTQGGANNSSGGGGSGPGSGNMPGSR